MILDLSLITTCFWSCFCCYGKSCEILSPAHARQLSPTLATASTADDGFETMWGAESTQMMADTQVIFGGGQTSFENIGALQPSGPDDEAENAIVAVESHAIGTGNPFSTSVSSFRPTRRGRTAAKKALLENDTGRDRYFKYDSKYITPHDDTRAFLFLPTHGMPRRTSRSRMPHYSWDSRGPRSRPSA